MIDRQLSIELPLPWENQTFTTDCIGAVNFLVGPNGSGKSQFAIKLREYLKSQRWNTRLLGTERLSEMTGQNVFLAMTGDIFSKGIGEEHFARLISAGEVGSGIDALVQLEKRLDLRIQIEATLSHLFDREISLNWESGRLVPKATLRGHNQSYRLDREECHGIRELLVMLTYLYDHSLQVLVIDEPELNLHPQYQAFFMREVRRVAGDPASNEKKKVVFLVTHSPFILDLRSEDDLNSVISFDLAHSEPRQVYNLDLDMPSLNSFIRRLNVHHKQFFFSDNPIFVEGIHDARIVEAMMEARSVSVASAGSCIIDAGGVEEVNQYLRLCRGLGKTAHFLYDIDSMFSGNLRAFIREDESIRDNLALAGLGTDIVKYCGQLEQKLTCIIDQLLQACLPASLDGLGSYMKKFGEDRSHWKPDQLPRARAAVMKAVDLHREGMARAVSPTKVKDIEGHWKKVLEILREKNIHVLPGGTLERYLPLFEGDIYALNQDAKRNAVEAEIELLIGLETEEELAVRYGELYTAVKALPSKEEVDVDPVLRNYLSEYIFKLQRIVDNSLDWQFDQIRDLIGADQTPWKDVFELQQFEADSAGGFSATIHIIAMLGHPERFVSVNDRTNAGKGDFQIEYV